MFVGTHDRQLDPKGRLALPAAYRSRLEPRCYLAFGKDKCIDVIPASDFEEVARDVMAAVKRGESSYNRQRALASSAVEVTVDAQGRVNLDEKLRSYAELTVGSRVVVSGAFDRIEIWSPERFDRVAALGTDEIAGAETGG